MDEEIPFYIRIKEGSMVYLGRKKYKHTQELFNHLNPKRLVNGEPRKSPSRKTSIETPEGHNIIISDIDNITHYHAPNTVISSKIDHYNK